MKEYAYTVAETAKLLRISRGSAYEAARRGQIPAVRIGRRWLVPCAALEQFLSALREAPEQTRDATA